MTRNFIRREMRRQVEERQQEIMKKAAKLYFNPPQEQWMLRANEFWRLRLDEE